MIPYIQVFGVSFLTSGLFWSFGFLFGFLSLFWHMKIANLPPKQMFVEVFVCVVFAMTGGRIFYVLSYKDSSEWLQISSLYFWKGGMVFYGAIIAMALGLFFLWRFKKETQIFLKLDLIILTLTSGHIFGRLGCFMHGCCYGCKIPADSLWPGVVFPFLDGVRHPTQIYSALFLLILYLFLSRIFKKEYKKRPGTVFLLWSLLYPCFRFLIEYVRDDPRPPFYLFSFLTVSQGISLLVFLSGGIFFYSRRHLYIGSNVASQL